MKTTLILQALALVALGQGSAHGAPVPLQNASITAAYNGEASGMLGLDHAFAAEPGSNTSTLDPSGTGVEFFTSDFLFGIDFDASGALTVIANYAIAPGPYSMRFDFGSSLAATPITAFTFASSSGTNGVPGLSIIDSHTIALDFGTVDWSEFGSVTALLQTADPVAVPEPGAPVIALAGLAALQTLDLSENKLTVLPAELAGLTSLQTVSTPMVVPSSSRAGACETQN